MITYKTPNNIIALTTEKDLSKLEDNNLAFSTTEDFNNVEINRTDLAQTIEIPLTQWVFASQCHSDTLLKVTKEDSAKGTLHDSPKLPDCDGLYTFDKDIALAFFHADCVPVLMYDETTHLIVAIHSGVIGTLKNITYKSIIHLVNHENINPDNLKVIIGPALSYQSSDYPLSDFDESDYDKLTITDDRAKIDVVDLTIQQCVKAGIPKENIDNSNLDTFEHPARFFSFLRDKKTGRHLSVIAQVSSR